MDFSPLSPSISSCVADDSTEQEQSTCYWKDVWRKLYSMRKSWELCDVALYSDEGLMFKAHSIVLAASSSIFNAQLVTNSNTFMEKLSPSEHHLHGINADVLQVTLDFIYGMAPETIANFKRLQKGADKLGIPAASSFCRQQLNELEQLARGSGNNSSSSSSARNENIIKNNNSSIISDEKNINNKKVVSTECATPSPSRAQDLLSQCPYLSKMSDDCDDVSKSMVPLKKRFLLKVLSQLKEEESPARVLSLSEDSQRTSGQDKGQTSKKLKNIIPGVHKLPEIASNSKFIHHNEIDSNSINGNVVSNEGNKDIAIPMQIDDKVQNVKESSCSMLETQCNGKELDGEYIGKELDGENLKLSKSSDLVPPNISQAKMHTAVCKHQQNSCTASYHQISNNANITTRENSIGGPSTAQKKYFTSAKASISSGKFHHHFHHQPDFSHLVDIPHPIPDLAFGDMGVQCPHLEKLVGKIDTYTGIPIDVIDENSKSSGDDNDNDDDLEKLATDGNNFSTVIKPKQEENFANNNDDNMQTQKSDSNYKNVKQYDYSVESSTSSEALMQDIQAFIKSKEGNKCINAGQQSSKNNPVFSGNTSPSISWDDATSSGTELPDLTPETVASLIQKETRNTPTGNSTVNMVNSANEENTTTVIHTADDSGTSSVNYNVVSNDGNKDIAIPMQIDDKVQKVKVSSCSTLETQCTGTSSAKETKFDASQNIMNSVSIDNATANYVAIDNTTMPDVLPVIIASVPYSSRNFNSSANNNFERMVDSKNAFQMPNQLQSKVDSVQSNSSEVQYDSIDVHRYNSEQLRKVNQQNKTQNEQYGGVSREFQLKNDRIQVDANNSKVRCPFKADVSFDVQSELTKAISDQQASSFTSTMANNDQQASSFTSTMANSDQQASSFTSTMANSNQQASSFTSTMANSDQQASSFTSTMANNDQQASSFTSTMANSDQQASSFISTVANSLNHQPQSNSLNSMANISSHCPQNRLTSVADNFHLKPQSSCLTPITNTFLQQNPTSKNMDQSSYTAASALKMPPFSSVDSMTLRGNTSVSVPNNSKICDNITTLPGIQNFNPARTNTSLASFAHLISNSLNATQITLMDGNQATTTSVSCGNNDGMDVNENGRSQISLVSASNQNMDAFQLQNSPSSGVTKSVYCIEHSENSNDGCSNREWMDTSENSPQECSSQESSSQEDLSYNNQTIFNMLKDSSYVNPDGKKIYKCIATGCEYNNKSMEYVQSHLYHRHGYGKPEISCSLCPRRYFSETQLKTHMKQTHDVSAKQRQHPCDICQSVFKTSQQLHMHQLKVHGKGKLFSCEDCAFKSPRKKDLQGHMISQHRKAPPGVRIYECQRCNYKCIDKNRFSEHDASHTQVKSFKCDFCKNYYATRRGLRNHLKYHSEERPHVCNICNATFKVRAKLRDHKRLLHEQKGEKPYKCGYCEFRASVRGNVNQHIRNIHKGQPITVIDMMKEHRTHVKAYDYANLTGANIEEIKDASAAGYASVGKRSGNGTE